MAYCTLDDILKIVPADDILQLTDDAGAGEIDPAKVDEAIAHAGELIDGYLRGRYSLPLNPVPGLINRLAADIAAYRLYMRRPPAGGLMDPVAERYKTAVKLLAEIQKGVVSLGEESVGKEPGIFVTNKRPEDRTFGKDVLGGF
jgi:phage gp36-like protein